VSGRESVHGAVPVSAKPAVVAVPVHRVRDPHAKCTPEQSRFAEHLARRPRFPNGSSAIRKRSRPPCSVRMARQPPTIVTWAELHFYDLPLSVQEAS
jgi:hypothetical protein